MSDYDSEISEELEVESSQNSSAANLSANIASFLNEKVTKDFGPQLVKKQEVVEHNDEYSYSFEEEEELHDAYSEDFEVLTPVSKPNNNLKLLSKIGIPIGSGKEVEDKKKTPDIKKSISFEEQAPRLIPSLGIDSLQTELYLDKLSKEIVFMRNQQRNTLRERRMLMVEKKQRAEDRRKKYNQDLINKAEMVEKLQHQNDLLQKQLTALNLSLESSQGTISFLQQKQEEIKNNLLNYEQEIQCLRGRIQEYEETIQKKEEISKKELCDANETIANMNKQRIELELTNAHLNKVILEMQQRHDDEKHSLPSFHQEVLDNKLLSLQQREEDYKRLDQDRHVQHERLMANIDVMKKDLMKEYKDKEYRLLADLEEERRSVANQRNVIQQEKIEFSNQIKTEQLKIELLLNDVKKREMDVYDKRRELDTNTSNFNLMRHMLEPEMLIRKQEIDDVNMMKQEIQGKLMVINSKLQHVESSEKSLYERESAVDSAWMEIQRKEQNLNMILSEHNSTEVELESNAKILYSERQKLKKCSIDLIACYQQLQRYILYFKKLQNQNHILSASTVHVRGEITLPASTRATRNAYSTIDKQNEMNEDVENMTEMLHNVLKKLADMSLLERLESVLGVVGRADSVMKLSNMNESAVLDNGPNQTPPHEPPPLPPQQDNGALSPVNFATRALASSSSSNPRVRNLSNIHLSNIQSLEMLRVDTQHMPYHTVDRDITAPVKVWSSLDDNAQSYSSHYPSRYQRQPMSTSYNVSCGHFNNDTSESNIASAILSVENMKSAALKFGVIIS